MTTVGDVVDIEKDYGYGHRLVWNDIVGAVNSAMMYEGDKLGLYVTLHELCYSRDDDDLDVSAAARATTATAAVELT